jgi:hypothetical protein
MLNQLVSCPMSLGRVELAGPLESVYKKNGDTKFRTSLPEKDRSLPCRIIPDTSEVLIYENLGSAKGFFWRSNHPRTRL